MANGINTHTVVGHLGGDPEIRYSSEGRARATFSVATGASWKDAKTGERKERTDWHNVVCFGKLADIARAYLKKGQQIYLEGENRTTSWEHEGKTYYRSQIVCRTLQMLGSAKAPTVAAVEVEDVFDEDAAAF